ncbi:MAG: hypothetical protein Ct9H300mP1_28200 [Planctomycetaceae bacterium]|nr:MAG: hypothetical protein Ct9H300mP1_28200 [Planctomycetaceae bacterium]
MAWWLLKIVGTRSGSADGPDRSRRFVSMMQRVGAGDLKPGLLMVGLGLVIFAGLLSLSRGGALALGTASLVCLVLFCRHRQVSGRLLPASPPRESSSVVACQFTGSRTSANGSKTGTRAPV